jgi:hypothetical protein
VAARWAPPAAVGTIRRTEGREPTEEMGVGWVRARGNSRLPMSAPGVPRVVPVVRLLTASEEEFSSLLLLVLQ